MQSAECWGIGGFAAQCEQTERCKGADGPVGPEKSVVMDEVGDGEVKSEL